ncbi:hypothetical protein [Butyrivibrio fibrisolvens]|uniref:hypothetical protein n=1 Tax=Butyrivibrio fibrisolvens TaxID=831 RepID=UPI0020BF0A01|nr:hypothetical protein [Butyrivibrio fibrisolvens]
MARERLSEERVFSDFTEESATKLFEEAGFEIASRVVGGDSRPGREAEMWINVIGICQ